MTEQNDPFTTANEPNYLAELVGEGKKFASHEDLAKGKWHSDTLIETLKGEIAALKEQNANGANVNTLLEEIRKLKGSTEDNGGQPNVETQTNPTPQNIEDLVLNTLNKAKAEEAVKSNKQKVIEKITQVWGDNASKELKNTADSLGVSVEYLNDVAQKSPSAFFKLTGLDTNRTPSSGTVAPTGSIRFDSKNSNVRDAKFYRELKQSNPKLYADQKTRIQMHRDAQELGEAYFN